MFRASFSEAIIEADQVVRKCNLGYNHALYRLTLRPSHIQALRALIRGPMTTAQMASEHSGVTARSISRYGAELRHWPMVQVCGKRGRSDLYRITEQGRAFLRNEVKMPRHVWPEDAPAECMPDDYRFLRDMKFEDMGDKVMHMLNAVPVPTAV